RLCRQQSCKSYCSRSADLNLCDAFLLKILEQFKQWRKPNLKAVILRKVEVGNRCEDLEPARLDKTSDLRIRAVFALFFLTQARDYREFNVAPNCFANHAFDAD